MRKTLTEFHFMGILSKWKHIKLLEINESHEKYSIEKYFILSRLSLVLKFKAIGKILVLIHSGEL